MAATGNNERYIRIFADLAGGELTQRSKLNIVQDFVLEKGGERADVINVGAKF
jgi:hypothetical protein